jgi:hypothetical protein
MIAGVIRVGGYSTLYAMALGLCAVIDRPGLSHRADRRESDSTMILWSHRQPVLNAAVFLFFSIFP